MLSPHLFPIWLRNNIRMLQLKMQLAQCFPIQALFHLVRRKIHLSFFLNVQICFLLFYQFYYLLEFLPQHLIIHLLFQPIIFNLLFFLLYFLKFFYQALYFLLVIKNLVFQFFSKIFQIQMLIFYLHFLFCHYYQRIKKNIYYLILIIKLKTTNFINDIKQIDYFC